MAAFENYDQVKAAYDALLAKKTKAQRIENVQRQQAIMGVNNYLRQNGYTGGAAESILLRANSNPVDYSAYDTQLADYQAMMKAFQQAGGSGRVAQPVTPSPAPFVPKVPTNTTAYLAYVKGRRQALGL